MASLDRGPDDEVQWYIALRLVNTEKNWARESSDYGGETPQNPILLPQGKYNIYLELRSETPPYKNSPWRVPFPDDFHPSDTTPYFFEYPEYKSIEVRFKGKDSYHGTRSSKTSWGGEMRFLLSTCELVTSYCPFELVWEPTWNGEPLFTVRYYLAARPKDNKIIYLFNIETEPHRR